MSQSSPDSVQPFDAQIFPLHPYYFGSSPLFGTRVPIAPDDAMRRSDEPLPHQSPSAISRLPFF